MPILYLALGSNLGDRRLNLQKAIDNLPTQVVLLEESHVYETPPWGVTDQPAFLNMVVKAETALSPLELLDSLKKLETHLGRTESVRYGPRLIDIDILYYDELCLDTPPLILPHPRMAERAFVLIPLADLAPGFIHPRLGKSTWELLGDLDVKGITRYD